MMMIIVTLKYIVTVILWFLLKPQLFQNVTRYNTMFYYRVTNYKCNRWETLT